VFSVVDIDHLCFFDPVDSVVFFDKVHYHGLFEYGVFEGSIQGMSRCGKDFRFGNLENISLTNICVDSL
jgi:hypothetical protein